MLTEYGEDGAGYEGAAEDAGFDWVGVMLEVSTNTAKVQDRESVPDRSSKDDVVKERQPAHFEFGVVFARAAIVDRTNKEGLVGLEQGFDRGAVGPGERGLNLTHPEDCFGDCCDWPDQDVPAKDSVIAAHAEHEVRGGRGQTDELVLDIAGGCAVSGEQGCLAAGRQFAPELGDYVGSGADVWRIVKDRVAKKTDVHRVLCGPFGPATQARRFGGSGRRFSRIGRARAREGVAARGRRRTGGRSFGQGSERVHSR